MLTTYKLDDRTLFLKLIIVVLLITLWKTPETGKGRKFTDSGKGVGGSQSSVLDDRPQLHLPELP